MARASGTKATSASLSIPSATSQSPTSAYWRLAVYVEDYPAPTRAIFIKDFVRLRSGKPPKRADAARNLDLLHRMDRGLLHYDTCARLELQNFIKDRGLKVPPKKRITDNHLIHTLELADDNATFGRLSSLPPELRNLIYDFHFMSYGYDSMLRVNEHVAGVPLAHSQPPLTRVSRLIRKETLALFYSTCTFNFDNFRSLNDNINNPKVRLPRVPVKIFGAMRKFSFGLRVRRHPVTRWFNITVELPIGTGGCRTAVVDLTHEMAPYLVVGGTIAVAGPADDHREVKLFLEEHASTRIDAALALGGGKLGKHDLQIALRDLQRAYAAKYPI